MGEALDIAVYGRYRADVFASGTHLTTLALTISRGCRPSSFYIIIPEREAILPTPEFDSSSTTGFASKYVKKQDRVGNLAIAFRHRKGHGSMPWPLFPAAQRLRTCDSRSAFQATDMIVDRGKS
jgi:hypothetical protein